MSRVFLVSCVAKKRPQPSPAADLYISDWFTKARAWVEASGGPWFILSAEHGLIAPDQVIAPYERTLNTMRSAERRAWAERVVRQMEQAMPQADKIIDEVIVLAGQRYREHLMPYLNGRFAQVSVPMEGLKIGEQLRWLGNATAR